MEAWRQVWREAVLPRLNRAGLVALRDGLAEDDPRLLQGFTTAPPPLDCYLDCPIEGACPVAYALWCGGRLRVVGEASVAFGLLRAEVQRQLGDAAAEFWRFVDNAPRRTLREKLLEEVRLALAEGE